MLNFYYDFGTAKKLTPYIGAGIGVGLTSTTVDVTFGTGSSLSISDHLFNNLVWQACCGVCCSVGQNVSVDFGYRYTDFGSLAATSVMPILDGVILTKTKTNVHEFLVGLRYTF
jgi:opacity protein-like surface antigen